MTMDQIMDTLEFFLHLKRQFGGVIVSQKAWPKMNSRTLLALGYLIAWSFAALPGNALAQTDYPERTIKIVVPAPPGAALDTIPRIIADKISTRFGKPV